MVKVRMLDRGPNGNYRAGYVYEVDRARAEILIEGGHAKTYKGPAAHGTRPKQEKGKG